MHISSTVSKNKILSVVAKNITSFINCYENNCKFYQLFLENNPLQISSIGHIKTLWISSISHRKKIVIFHETFTGKKIKFCLLVLGKKIGKFINWLEKKQISLIRCRKNCKFHQSLSGGKSQILWIDHWKILCVSWNAIIWLLKNVQNSSNLTSLFFIYAL